MSWLTLGGPAMWVLAVMSVAMLTVVILKAWEFSERGVNARSFVEPAIRAWENGQAEAALLAVAASGSPLALTLGEAMRTLRDPRYGSAQARERIERFAVEQIESTRGWLRALELIATLAPLIGLLGTVLGMIEAFQALQAAGDRVDPSILSGGIWQALLTTAAGLVIAVPALVALHAFERGIEALQHAMESALTRLLTAPGIA